MLPYPNKHTLTSPPMPLKNGDFKPWEEGDPGSPWGFWAGPKSTGRRLAIGPAPFSILKSKLPRFICRLMQDVTREDESTDSASRQKGLPQSATDLFAAVLRVLKLDPTRKLHHAGGARKSIHLGC